jgi:hypothetical protein
MGKFKRKAQKRKAKQAIVDRPVQSKGSGESLREFIEEWNRELYQKGHLAMHGIVAEMGGIPPPVKEPDEIHVKVVIRKDPG